MIVGLDYEVVRSHGAYRQALRQAIVRARSLGSKRVLLGMGATFEKTRFGAHTQERVAFAQALGPLLVGGPGGAGRRHALGVISFPGVIHEGQPVVRRGPALEEARAVCVLLHGRGRSPEDVLGLAERLALDDVAFVAPRRGGQQLVAGLVPGAVQPRASRG